jgi:ABC-2 type transport system permease protein
MWELTWREVKDRRWFLLSFLIGSVALLWIYVATFYSSAASIASLKALVKTYPKALLDAIGLTSFDIDTLEKYLNVKHFSLIWPLMAIVLALSRAGGQIAGEVQNGTLGLLLALPLPRWRIFAGKYVAGLLTTLIFAAVSVFAVIPLAAAYKIPTHPNILLCAFILTTLFIWSIYSVAMLVSAWVSDRGRVYVICGAVLLLSYTANIVAMIDSQLAWLKYYSVFFYFDTQKVLGTGGITLRSYAVFLSLIVISSALALWQFTRRDIGV